MSSGSMGSTGKGGSTQGYSGPTGSHWDALQSTDSTKLSSEGIDYSALSGLGDSGNNPNDSAPTVDMSGWSLSQKVEPFLDVLTTTLATAVNPIAGLTTAAAATNLLSPSKYGPQEENPETTKRNPRRNVESVRSLLDPDEDDEDTESTEDTEDSIGVDFF